MKKRKKPTALIIALVLLVSTAAGINAYQMGLLKPSAGHGPGDGHGHDEPALDKARDTKESAADVAKDTKESVQQMRARAESMAKKMRGPVKTEPGKPMIAVEKPKPYVPKPNDSSIGSQWYTDQSMKEIKKDGS
jgi:hypothetical protein